MDFKFFKDTLCKFKDYLKKIEENTRNGGGGTGGTVTYPDQVASLETISNTSMTYSNFKTLRFEVIRGTASVTVGSSPTKVFPFASGNTVTNGMNFDANPSKVSSPITIACPDGAVLISLLV